MLAPVYEKVKLHLGEFIKRIEDCTDDGHVSAILDIPSLNSFLESFSAEDDGQLLAHMPSFLDYLHKQD